VEIPLLDDQFESESFQLIRGVVQEEIEIAIKEKRL
jgi:hypothetical protein